MTNAYDHRLEVHVHESKLFKYLHKYIKTLYFETINFVSEACASVSRAERPRLKGTMWDVVYVCISLPQ
jgi:hypothetical protein